jgi:hypothetical protein
VAADVGIELRFRTGVNTGPVLMAEGENLAVGDAVNVAARLEQAAEPGEILIGEETLRLVRDAVEVEPRESFELKGKSAPVRVFRLVAVDPLAPGRARRLDAPLVGRRRELGLLHAAWDRTVQESACHLFTLLGAAGVGKSRLVSELLGKVGDKATVLSGRCLPYGEGITFWPLAEALSPIGHAARPALERLGAGGVAVPEELFWEVRRLLESLATDRSVILHIDDLQWAERMLLDLLDHVVDLSRGAPILVLCVARPELLDERPAWGGGKLNSTTVLLEPLEPGECVRLLEQLGDGLEPSLRERVIAASEGNPLFLEEMAALASERDTVAVPSTIQALLAARLERLESEERDLLERGAIEGEVFHLSAVCALTGEPSASAVEPRLAGLVRKELIRPHPATFHGDQAFRFRHLLIRDAAYDALPKATRVQLHERYAGWLEENASELAELDEIAGWHLEQTLRYQHELRRRPDPALASRAAQHLDRAGRRARDRGDISAARNLLERGHTLAPDDTLRAQIGVDLAEQLIEAGDLTRADTLLSAGERCHETAALANLTRLEWLWWAHGSERRTIDAGLPENLSSWRESHDERGLARAHMLAFGSYGGACRYILAAEQARLAAEHAHNAGDRGLRSRALGWYVLALIHGPADSEAITDELDAIEREESSPYLAGWIAVGRAEVARLAGRFGDARRQLRHAGYLFRAMGTHTLAAGINQMATETELSAGRPDKALPGLLEADASLAEMGERGIRATTHALLARVFELLGDSDSARTAIELAEDLGGPHDVSAIIITHAVRARLALEDGVTSEAERWARSAVDYADRTDMTLEQARARFELARVLSSRGRRDDASSEAGAALELYRAKGDRPGVAEAQALLDTLDVCG